MSTGDALLTVMCPACAQQAQRLVPGVVLRQLGAVPRGRAS